VVWGGTGGSDLENTENFPLGYTSKFKGGGFVGFLRIRRQSEDVKKSENTRGMENRESKVGKGGWKSGERPKAKKAGQKRGGTIPARDR